MVPYERFKAWERCHELVLAVYRASGQWPREETYGLVAQARRAAFSAAANIVEGAAREGRREFAHFLSVSKASLQELAYILRLAKDLGLSPEGELEGLEKLRESASKLTWLLFRAVQGRGGGRPAMRR